MKKIVLAVIWMIPTFLFGQSYESLWKQVEDALNKDLPQTEQQVLRQIAAKAEKEKRRQELEAKIAAFDSESDAELSERLRAVKTRLVREHSENTDRMEADMTRALRMLDKEFASQMKKDADDIVKEILK